MIIVTKGADIVSNLDINQNALAPSNHEEGGWSSTWFVCPETKSI